MERWGEMVGVAASETSAIRDGRGKRANSWGLVDLPEAVFGRRRAAGAGSV